MTSTSGPPRLFSHVSGAYLRENVYSVIRLEAKCVSDGLIAETCGAYATLSISVTDHYRPSDRRRAQRGLMTLSTKERRELAVALCPELAAAAKEADSLDAARERVRKAGGPSLAELTERCAGLPDPWAESPAKAPPAA